MKLTLANIRSIKQKTDNPLTKYVCNYVIDEWSGYDDKTNIFKNVLAGDENKDITLILDYAFRRIFGANTNLLILTFLGHTLDESSHLMTPTGIILTTNTAKKMKM